MFLRILSTDLGIGFEIGSIGHLVNCNKVKKILGDTSFISKNAI